jgi:hypothetical protein
VQERDGAEVGVGGGARSSAAEPCADGAEQDAEHGAGKGRIAGQKRMKIQRSSDVKREYILAVLAGAVSLVGCVESADPEDARPEVFVGEPITVLEGSFADHFVLVDSITPEQSEEEPIIRVSGALLTEDQIIVVDVSEANAKIFDRSTGRRIAILGRKGQGPAEFESPRYPVLDTSGVICTSTPS